MRKISANLILLVSSVPLRNGIILVNPDGSIADLVDTGGHLREEPGLEFYPGTIIPGLIIPWFHLDDFYESQSQIRSLPDDQDPAEPIEILEKLDKELFRFGIKGVGLVLSESMASNAGFKLMSKSSLCYHPVIELCPGRNDDEYKVFNRGIDLVSLAWNEYNLTCSLTACSPAMEYSDIGKYLEEYHRSHINLLPPEGQKSTRPTPPDPKNPQISNPDYSQIFDLDYPQQTELTNSQAFYENRFNILNNAIKTFPGLSFEEVVSKFTQDAAAKILCDDELGSIEKGKKPGLNLVTGFAEGDSDTASEIALKVLV